MAVTRPLVVQELEANCYFPPVNCHRLAAGPPECVAGVPPARWESMRSTALAHRTYWPCPLLLRRPSSRCFGRCLQRFIFFLCLPCFSQSDVFSAYIWVGKCRVESDGSPCSKLLCWNLFDDVEQFRLKCRMNPSQSD